MRSQYYPEQSNPLKDQYIFVYKVKITNQSPQTVQLVSRTWEIKAIEATEVRTYVRRCDGTLQGGKHTLCCVQSRQSRSSWRTFLLLSFSSCFARQDSSGYNRSSKQQGMKS